MGVLINQINNCIIEINNALKEAADVAYNNIFYVAE